VPVLRADVVGVELVSRSAVEKPAISRVPHQEQVIVGLDVREAAPEVRSDAALRVLFGEGPELTGDEDTVTGVKMLMDVVRNMLAERVEGFMTIGQVMIC